MAIIDHNLDPRSSDRFQAVKGLAGTAEGFYRNFPTPNSNVAYTGREASDMSGDLWVNADVEMSDIAGERFWYSIDTKNVKHSEVSRIRMGSSTRAAFFQFSASILRAGGH